MTLRARRGGALYPVLMISIILFMLSAMLPKMLIQSGSALRTDRNRTRTLMTLESGVSMAEARLKREMADDLLAGVTSRPPRAWTAAPSFDNPDFGRRHDSTFRVKVLDTKPYDVVPKGDGVEDHRFSYRLDAKAWERRGGAMRVSVTGLIVVSVRVDVGRSGIPNRTIVGSAIQSINQELPAVDAPPPGAFGH